MKHLTHTLKVSFTYTTLESQYVHEVQIQDAINIQLNARYMRLKSINILVKDIEQGFEIYINQNLDFSKSQTNTQILDFINQRIKTKFKDY